MANNTSQHILNTSANLLGFCLFVITSLHIANLREAHYIDELIMMSQNRKEEKDRKRSENDYLINLKAELEVRSLHQKFDLLLEEQINVLFESQAKQLEILKNIEQQIMKSK